MDIIVNVNLEVLFANEGQVEQTLDTAQSWTRELSFFDRLLDITYPAKGGDQPNGAFS